MKISVTLIATFLVFFSCQNRDLNEGEEFRPREVHDSFQDSHFAKVTIDGVEYLMMERDNNNPHEGFGFMAFRGNQLIEKQDTAIAYLKSVYEMQTRIYAVTSNRDIEDVRTEANELFLFHLKEEQLDLNRLESDSLTSRQTN